MVISLALRAQNFSARPFSRSNLTLQAKDLAEILIYISRSNSTAFSLLIQVLKQFLTGQAQAPSFSALRTKKMHNLHKRYQELAELAKNKENRTESTSVEHLEGQGESG